MAKPPKSQKYSNNKYWLTRRVRVVVLIPVLLFSFLLTYFFLDSARDTLDQTTRCANSLSCKESFVASIENGATGFFAGNRILAPLVDLNQNQSDSQVLGESESSDKKRIEVDLTNQTISAYDGDTLFMKAFISSGKWFPTPTGEFRIWSKLISTRMSGGEGASYYDLPNVPFTMFFEGDTLARSRGFAIHGAYWHNNFGHPMSHGCINMRHKDVEKLFNWANPISTAHTTSATSTSPGTKIIIFGQAPL